MSGLEQMHPAPGQWGECARCGYPNQKTSAHGRGLVHIGGDTWICADGRECGLRLGRRRRAAKGGAT